MIAPGAIEMPRRTLAAARCRSLGARTLFDSNACGLGVREIEQRRARLLADRRGYRPSDSGVRMVPLAYCRTASPIAFPGDLQRQAGLEQHEAWRLRMLRRVHHRDHAAHAPAAEDGMHALRRRDLHRHRGDIGDVVLHRDGREVDRHAAAVAAQVQHVDLPAQAASSARQRSQTQAPQWRRRGS